MNALLTANFNAINNENNRSVFEFRYNWSDYGETFNPLDFVVINEAARTYCGNKLQDTSADFVYEVRNATSRYTIITIIVERAE